jgi:hypothetical protein
MSSEASSDRESSDDESQLNEDQRFAGTADERLGDFSEESDDEPYRKISVMLKL